MKNTPGNMDETQMAIMCSQVEDTEANNVNKLVFN